MPYFLHKFKFIFRSTAIQYRTFFYPKLNQTTINKLTFILSLESDERFIPQRNSTTTFCVARTKPNYVKGGGTLAGKLEGKGGARKKCESVSPPRRLLMDKRSTIACEFDTQSFVPRSFEKKHLPSSLFIMVFNRPPFGPIRN